MRYRDPQHFDNTTTELARRLGITKEAVMQMPIVNLARLMGEKGVTMGLQAVT